MECDICAREGKELTELGMHCVSCARTAIYLKRLEHGQTLLKKDAFGTRIQALSEGSRDEKRLQDVWSIESNRTRSLHVRNRITEQQEAVISVRQQVEDLKAEIAHKKADIAKRTSILKTTKGTLAGQDRGQLDRFADKTGRGIKSFDSRHQASVETRAYLCREAANLLRFRQAKPRGAPKGHVLRYFIGTMPIPDLKSINGARCSDLTAMLASLSRLICLVAFYLGVRLPAEITLPHRNYPLATINTPGTSYTSSKVEFPGSGSYLAMTETSKNNESRSTSRPRPLFIGSDDRNELVSDLARKDPSAFKFFVEATSLLAWDIAWLAHSQGMSSGSESWADVCNLGASLWAVVFATPQSSAIRRALARQGQVQHDSAHSRSSTPVDSQPGELGAFSHASAHSPLTTATRMAHIRGLRLSKYTMVADPLRKTLENEMKNAEWEVLKEEEIFDGGETFDEAVLIPSKNTESGHYDATRSIMSVTTHVSEPLNGRPKGTSGWTKVKDNKTRD